MSEDTHAYRQQPYCVQPPRARQTFSPGLAPGRVFAITRSNMRWTNGTQLSYFMYSQASDDIPPSWVGSGSDMEIVRKAFGQWAALGLGIDFAEVHDPHDAVIRIGFQRNPKRSWSFVGTEMRNYREPSVRTMNFGWALDQDAYGLTTALHEIGHSIGLEHEHQNPNAGIVWDEAAVLEYFKRTNGWNAAETRHNVLNKVEKADEKSTQWDPDSIMEYWFAPNLIISPEKYRNGLYPPGGLSDDDMRWAKEVYPSNAEGVPSLSLDVSKTLELVAGETRTFLFSPAQAGVYRFRTIGTADSTMVLFEKSASGNMQLAADEDSGEDRNAQITRALESGKQYVIGVRLHYSPDASNVRIEVTKP